MRLLQLCVVIFSKLTLTDLLFSIVVVVVKLSLRHLSLLHEDVPVCLSPTYLLIDRVELLGEKPEEPGPVLTAEIAEIVVLHEYLEQFL